jgi:dTDP-glucose pyrophosphorylase
MDLSEVVVTKETTILEAMQLFNATGRQMALVAQDGKLEAVVTDGDNRRFIVKGGSIQTQVADISNYNPRFIFEKDKESAKKVMQKYSINALPVLNDNGIIVSVVFANDLEITKKHSLNIPIVIMAGGFGTRLYPYTKILPKPLIPIGEIPIVEHIINRFHKYNCKDFYMIVNYKKNMIKSYFSEVQYSYNLNFVEEEKPLGTGGGISLLKGIIDKPFFLSNCDILIDADYEDIYKQHKQQKNIITMVCAFRHMTVPYGVVELDKHGKINRMSEKPQYSFLTNTGMYLLEPRVVEEMKNDEAISLPEIIERYRSLGENIGVYPVNEKCWLDMGQLEELEEMRKAMEEGHG